MWDGIGKETFRVFRMWLKRRATVRPLRLRQHLSRTLRHATVMEPWPTPSSTVSHPSRKASKQWDAHLCLAMPEGSTAWQPRWGRRDSSGSVPPQGRLRQAVRFCVTFPGHVRDGEFQRPRQLLAGPVQ